jgi:hypothetical protein
LAHVKALAALTVHRLPPEGVTHLRLSSTAEDRIAAVGIARHELASAKGLRQWQSHFTDYVPFALAHCKDADHMLRLSACQWLREIIVCPDLVSCTASILQSVYLALADLIDDPFPEVRSEAVAGLKATWRCGHFPVPTCTAALVKALHTSQSSSTASRGWLFLLETLGTIVDGDPSEQGRSPPSAACTMAPAFCDAVRFLVATFVHDLSEVRKTVVGVLVKYLLAFDSRQLLPLLLPLTLSQQKLVSIYYNRSAADRGLSGALAQRDLAKEIEAYGSSLRGTSAVQS